MLECLIELLYNRLSSFRTSASRVAECSAQPSDMSAQPFGSSEAVNDGSHDPNSGFVPAVFSSNPHCPVRASRETILRRRFLTWSK